MPSRLLPLELLDLVTDVLSDDHETLNSCTLACHSLRFSAQRHLFRRIYLTASSGPEVGSCEALQTVLCQSPHLVTAIRELRLHVGLDAPDTHFFWLAEGNNLHFRQLLPQLANVRNIHISNFSQNALIWNQIPIYTREAILRAFTSPRLHSLTLNKLAFHSTTEYMTIFANSLAVKELYMWVACCLVGPRASFVCNEHGGYEGDVLIPKIRPQFEKLWMKMSAGDLGENIAYPDTKYCIDAFLHPRASLDATTNLKRFCISIHPEDDHWPIQPLLDRAHQLEELVVEMDVLAAASGQGLDFSRIPSVYLVSLFMLSGLNELFYGIHQRESSRLKHLTIEYDISGLDAFFAEMSGFEEIDWLDFEEKMLINSSAITFVICGRTADPILTSYFMERLPARLPRLAKKDMLKVDYVLDPPSQSWAAHF